MQIHELLGPSNNILFLGLNFVYTIIIIIIINIIGMGFGYCPL
jgi:Na+-transporting methylmalonyl-CoA/oxaloacetate decarboxylase gamma subunit